MMRSPVVISRLTYHREAQQVRIKKRNPASGDDIVLDVLDFIARLSVQIPDPHERIVLYYGLYSNASGGRRTTQDEKELTPPATGFSRCDESEYSKSRRIRWAKLIAKVWKEDPLLCKKCGGKMRIISFITDPVVIDRILLHIGWNYCDPPPPRYHPPPHLCTSPLC